MMRKGESLFYFYLIWIFLFLFCMMIISCSSNHEEDQVNDITLIKDTCGGMISIDHNKGFAEVSGRFCEDQTFENEYIYRLCGVVFIGNDDPEIKNRLKIQKGTVINGSNTIPPGALVVTRHAKLEAIGTATEPIIFTSPVEVGKRTPGDWGGIIINGNALINTCSSPPCENLGEAASGLYGGENDTDSSGTIKFIRIEFAGHSFSSDDEMNGLSLQGVGSNTTIDNIQIHRCKDDGVELFGGAAHIKHLVVSGCGDDSIDWTFGWHGRIQHLVIQHSINIVDSGISCDQNGFYKPTFPDDQFPIIANATVVGNLYSNQSETGLLIGEASVNIYSSIVYRFGTGINIIDWTDIYTDTGGNVLTGYVALADCILFNNNNFSDDSESYFESEFYQHCNDDSRFGNNTTEDPQLRDPNNQTNPDFIPILILPNMQDPHTIDPWFDNASYIGAFSAEGANWLDGWTSFELN